MADQMMRGALGALLAAVPLVLFSAEGPLAPASRSSGAEARDVTHAPFAEGLVGDLIGTRDTDDFTRRSTRVAAMIDYKSIYDFIAIGANSDYFKQGGWSARANSLLGALRKVDRRTAEGVFAFGGIADLDGSSRFFGNLTWNVRFSGSTGSELIAQRDFVETQPALRDRTMADFLAVSLDHAVADRLTLIGMPTYRRFSDGNEQKGVRGWLIYVVAPEQGVSVELRARAYESSQPGGTAYFSPANYERAELGLRMRRAVGDWRVYASAGGGEERVNSDAHKPAGHLDLQALRTFHNNASLGLALSYFRSVDSTTHVGIGDKYAWRMARLYFTIPF